MVFAEALRSRRACRNCMLLFSTGPRGDVFASAILFPLRARMMLAIDRLQSIKRYVGVDLRGRYIGVAKKSLDGAQVGTILHHVSGATVAQHVRAGFARPGGRGSTHQLPHPLARQSLAAFADE